RAAMPRTCLRSPERLSFFRRHLAAGRQLVAIHHVRGGRRAESRGELRLRQGGVPSRELQRDGRTVAAQWRWTVERKAQQEKGRDGPSGAGPVGRHEGPDL